jgi:gas vesicle protein
MGSGKVLVGVLAGVAVGATLGILFAPDKGSNTRRKISSKGNAYAQDLEEKFNEFIEGITKQFEAAKNEAVEAMENAQEEEDTTETPKNTAT